MRYWYGCIHALVECEDCEWGTGSHKNAQALAAQHAKKYGHRVSGELGISFGYNGREESGEDQNN